MNVCLLIVCIYSMNRDLQNLYLCLYLYKYLCLYLVYLHLFRNIQKRKVLKWKKTPLSENQEGLENCLDYYFLSSVSAEIQGFKQAVSDDLNCLSEPRSTPRHHSGRLKGTIKNAQFFLFSLLAKIQCKTLNQIKNILKYVSPKYCLQHNSIQLC